MKTAIPQFLIALLIVCLGLSQNTQAVSPTPDGGYPGGNTAEGQNALLSLTSGIDNNALVFQALYHNTNGNYNTAEGFRALFSNTTGSLNTANGVNALFSNTTGSQNTGTGVNALFRNTTGFYNTASGVLALFSNTTGDGNTANGVGALQANTTSFGNTATGFVALNANTTGDGNMANGAGALQTNTIGNNNTASGYQALNANREGRDNTANGEAALFFNTTGNENTALGSHALAGNLTVNDGNGNRAVGFAALTASSGGSLNTALGHRAGQGLQGGESNNIDIGANVEGVAGESNTIRIGNTDITDTFISGISGTTVATGAAVLVDSSGHLGTVTSSKRFKEEIRPMNKTSEAIFSLEPVTFRYKKEIDPAGTSQFGLIAEEVAKVNPALVLPDKEGKPYTVRYEAVNAMLLNEFLKEHRTVQGQQKEINALKAELKEEKALIQKVSDQIQVTKPGPQVVNNP